MIPYAKIDSASGAILDAPVEAPIAEFGLAGWTNAMLANPPSASPDLPAGMVDRAWLLIRQNNLPPFDPVTQRLGDPTFTKVGQEVVATRALEDLPPDQIKTNRIAAIDAQLAASDAAFKQRWVEDLAAPRPPSPAFMAWSAGRDALRAERAAVVAS